MLIIIQNAKWKIEERQESLSRPDSYLTWFYNLPVLTVLTKKIWGFCYGATQEILKKLEKKIKPEQDSEQTQQEKKNHKVGKIPILG